MTCQLGQVVDLSGSGMRIVCKGKPPLAVGQMSEFKLKCSEGVIPLRGQAMWMRRTRPRRFEVGIRFVQIKPGVSQALESLARFGFFGKGGGPGLEPGASGTKTRRGRIRASIDVPDYYRVLGVSPQAPKPEIKAAYRKLAARYHPDVAGNDEAAREKFSRVQEAYEVLNDPERRAMYDLRTAA